MRLVRYAYPPCEFKEADGNDFTCRAEERQRRLPSLSEAARSRGEKWERARSVLNTTALTINSIVLREYCLAPRLPPRCCWQPDWFRTTPLPQPDWPWPGRLAHRARTSMAIVFTMEPAPETTLSMSMWWGQRQAPRSRTLRPEALTTTRSSRSRAELKALVPMK